MSWGRTNLLLADACARLGVRCEPISTRDTDFFARLSVDGRAALVSKTRSPFLTQVAQTLVNNKFVSREVMAAVGVPVVAGLLVDEDAPEAVEAALARWGDVVVKPNWGNRGLAVTVGLTTMSEVRACLAHARGEDRDEEALVEPHLPGTNVRCSVIGGRFEAALEIRRPVLEGDGERTPRALVAALNEDSRRGTWKLPGRSPLDQVDLEDGVAARMRAAGVDPDAPLPSGARFVIVEEELETIDVTADVHPDFRRLSELACVTLGADVAGVDWVGPLDAFSRPYDAAASPRVLEVNVLPALHLHAVPTQGQPRPVFEAFVRYCLQMDGAPAPGGPLPAPDATRRED